MIQWLSCLHTPEPSVGRRDQHQFLLVGHCTTKSEVIAVMVSVFGSTIFDPDCTYIQVIILQLTWYRQFDWGVKSSQSSQRYSIVTHFNRDSRWILHDSLFVKFFHSLFSSFVSCCYVLLPPSVPDLNFLFTDADEFILGQKITRTPGLIICTVELILLTAATYHLKRRTSRTIIRGQNL